MRPSLEGLDAQLEAAERAIMSADLRLRQDAALLRAKAGKVSSYIKPASAVAGLATAWKVRQFLTRPPAGRPRGRRSWLIGLLMRFAIPALTSLAAGKAARNADAATPQKVSTARPAPRVSATLDRARFAGTWFEVARLHAIPSRRKAPTRVSLTYALTEDGFDVTETVSERGRIRSSRGIVTIADVARHPAEMSVTMAPSVLRWMPLLWADHWILEIAVDYSFVLIGDRNRKALRMLSRTDSLDPQVYEMLVRTAAAEGYPVERIKRTGPASFVA